MADPYAQNRPLSVTIPQTFGAQGPYCLRRPNLSDILGNESPPPWTLSAFMAYLSQNHCLETLEFTMDASRYGKHYAKMVARLPGRALLPGSEEANYLLMLWQRLLEAYIAPNGPREVNLPSEVRNGLLSLVPNLGGLPPPPNALDTAVQHIYALMEESVLVPFLNSFYPHSAHPEYETSEDNNFYSAATHQQQTQSPSTYTAHTSRSYDERYRSQTHQSQPAYTSSSASLSSSSSSSNNNTAHNRASAPSTFQHIARNFSVRAPTSQRSSASPALLHLHHHHDSSKSASPSPAGTDSDMTDADLLSTISTTTSASITAAAAAATASSPTTASVGLHTPPNTPPTGDYYYCHGSPYESGGGGSPVGSVGTPASAAYAHAPHHEGSSSSSSPREKERAGTWKRVGSKLGLRKSGTSRRGSPPGGAGDVVMEE